MGRAEDICRQVKRFENLGIELLLVKFIPTVENVRQIGNEVISQVGSKAPSSTARPAAVA
jgi:hypothetical protein